MQANDDLWVIGLVSRWHYTMCVTKCVAFPDDGRAMKMCSLFICLSLFDSTSNSFKYCLS